MSVNICWKRTNINKIWLKIGENSIKSKLKFKWKSNKIFHTMDANESTTGGSRQRPNYIETFTPMVTDLNETTETFNVDNQM